MSQTISQLTFALPIIWSRTFFGIARGSDTFPKMNANIFTVLKHNGNVNNL